MALNVAFAEKFITKLTAYTSYNINIMNQKGIIIASRNPERVGDFHEIAFDMISEHKDVIEVSEQEEFLGVQPGINLAVVCEGEWLGVVGTTGKPGEVRPIAMVIKMALETMLEYEKQKEQMLKRQNLKEQFMNLLLYDEHPDQVRLKSMAEQLGYQEQIPRISILCVPVKEINRDDAQEKMTVLIKESLRHTPQDISFCTHDKRLLIFKTLQMNERILADYKYCIEEYLEELSKRAGRCFRFYAGSVQDQFIYYRSAYQHCTWLESREWSEEQLLYFYDHVDAYIKNLIPTLELHKIFSAFSKRLPGGFIENYLEIMNVLKENDYNLEISSKKLFVHKNTLVFRLDKIRSLLNMNPIRETKDREFMEYLLYYLKK
ncbi:MAG TPA: helix-turn-helix domain-containing protein [Candidatus Dorea faecigallinarum]|nr:helix-turn-helix domain-containing protein [Candidatus Dorea faecigallinarum]